MSTLAEILRGRPAHLDPVAVVADLPWELTGHRVAHLPHTVWQLVGHMIYWMDLELRCIEGPEVPYPEHSTAGWPAADGPADRDVWEMAVTTFKTSLVQLVKLADARASTLARIVHPRKGTTVESVLLVLAAHNSYHVGQIVQVRQALGAWPPAGGEMKW